MKKTQSRWTHFMDMHSGGGQKLEWAHIYIEAPQKEAEIVFYNRFRRNPNRVTCTCCGEDYSIREGINLAQVTGFERGCRSLETPLINGRYVTPDEPKYHEHYYLEKNEKPPKGYHVSKLSPWGDYQTLAEFIKRKDVHIIYAQSIKQEERRGELPEEGYVWTGGRT